MLNLTTVEFQVRRITSNVEGVTCSQMIIGWILDHWGSLVSVAGLLVSSIGLFWAIKFAYGARKASLDTSTRIVSHLRTIDLQRAIGLIQRIKLLHNIERWHGALEQYQTLRAMMADIIVRCPPEEEKRLSSLSTARTLLITMENSVEGIAGQGIAGQGMSERERSRFQEQLNQIQVELEALVSSIGFGD